MHVARLLLALAVCTTPLAPTLLSVPAVAQAPAAEAPLPCNGTVNIVRVSEIKPGMMSKFLEAVAAQLAWYKDAGSSDEIGVMRVMERDPDTKAYKVSETQAITTHVMVGEHKDLPHNEAWDAFVKMFAESSTIKNAYLTCTVKE